MLSGMRRVRLRVAIGRRCNSGAGDKTAGGGDCESPLRQLVADAGGGGEAGGGEGDLQWATQPYAGSERRPVAGDGTVLLFPGQGAQYVGMGRGARDVPAAMDVYDEASETLGWDVWRVCAEGPEERLAERAQPALLATCLAALAAAREARPAALARARVAAGFSLGEWAALVWAGALTAPAALRALEARQAAMRAAAAARPGGLLAVWLAPAAPLPALLAAAREAAPGAVCAVANYLYPGCRVLAGDEQALAWVERAGRAHGVVRSARVAAGGAWHCALMEAGAAAVRAALAREELRAPRRRVLSCVDAREYRSAADVARRLAAHVTAPVRWEQTMGALYARAAHAAQPTTLCVGPARELRAWLRRCNARAWDRALLVDI